MKLLAEATIDDQFNVQMGKIQQAIIELEKIAETFSKGDATPVASQKAALNAASQDLLKVRNFMFNIYGL